VDENGSAPSHKLSAVQQTHILDDIRRHNLEQQSWTTPAGLAPSRSVTDADGEHARRLAASTAADQLQQLLQINGVAATDGPDHVDDDRRSRQKSVPAASGWHPQSTLYNRQQQQPQKSPSLSPYVSPPPQYQNVQPQNQQYQQPSQYYPTTTLAGPAVPQHRYQQQQQQKQQLFVTSPSPQQEYYPALRPAGDEIDADVEQQIRQQLTAAMATNGNDNYTVTDLASGVTGSASLSASDNGGVTASNDRLHLSAASNENVQYVQIGPGNGDSSSSRNRVQLETGPSAADNKNTIVKTVIVRQKPARQPSGATSVAVPSSVPQQPWTAAEQQQLEQLARQVLPPGVAQYEIIRAGGVDGTGGKPVTGDATAAAAAAAATTVSASPRPTNAVDGNKQPAASTGGKKKPVTFVILEERPDGTVRVRGVEKKQQNGGDTTPVAAADDEQLQQLVDKLNRGELRLPSAGGRPSSNVAGTDGVVAASTTTAYVPSSSAPSIAPPKVPDGNSHGHNAYREPPSPSHHFPTVSPVTTAFTTLPHRQYQNFFVPTVVPTAVTVTATEQQKRYHHLQNHEQQQEQQQYYNTPLAITTTSSTRPPTNSTSSYHRHNNKATKDGTFSGVLRSRGYYAMAKYMRQAGIDAVLEETGNVLFIS